MKVTFLGAAETVTGSKFLVEAGGARLLVDCGLFQGLKPLRLRNREPFPIAPRELDAVVLTHAHMDHSGYLPVLVRDGFSGLVYCTAATRDLCEILLPDSGHIQEEEADYANKHATSKHHPALPLYTVQDAEQCLDSFRAVPFGTQFTIGGTLTVTLTPAGHILGAACVHVSDGRRTLVFSGDVGRPHDPLMQPPQAVQSADYLIVESTYGNRPHDPRDAREILAEVVVRTVRRKGILLIPAFAVGRAQTLLHLLAELKAARRISDVPVYVDSPMATDVTDISCRHAGEHRLSEQACRRLCSVARYVRSVEESKALNRRPGPMIIVSASGMAAGGRILHHLEVFAPNRRNTILFTGYQAAGTRGEAMLAGAGQIKIHGEYVPVHAEIVSIDSLSAHADNVELIDWLRQTGSPPQRTFIVHGEPPAQDAFRRHLADALGWDSHIPRLGETVELD
jgi:metallo-beta-lactamase family protein